MVLTQSNSSGNSGLAISAKSDADREGGVGGGGGGGGLVESKQSWLRLPLFVVIAAAIFGATATVGGVVGYMTISQAKSTALTIADQIQMSFMESANATVRSMLQSTVQLTVLQASDIDTIFVSRLYQRSAEFPFVATSGMYFRPRANGSQAFLGLGSSPGEIDWQDDSVNNSLWQLSPIAGVSDNGKIQYAPVNIPVLPHLSLAPPSSPRGGWAPGMANGPQTFILAFDLPVWAGLVPYRQRAGEEYAAAFYSLLSVRSLDEYLQAIPMTPNGVLALVHAETGLMYGSTTANISESWPVHYTAVGNPNGLVGAAATEVARRYGKAAGGAVNATTAFAGIADRSDKSFEFSYGGDTVYCSTAWIVDEPTQLALVLLLAIPSSDFLGQVNVTIRNAIIFVGVFCGAALILGVLLAYALVGPLRRVVVSIEKATKFDFSTLQSDRAAGHSWIAEIAQLELSFFTMLKKFAEAVRNNKSLVGGSSVKGSKK
ncbi:hypothetical protein DFJ73DRAFT_933878 [Zopfochytrium polystomum]|nr:hypothetical protein DFJ73DRAFT_933878 [Zopfochytrium polystomum]